MAWVFIHGSGSLGAGTYVPGTLSNGISFGGINGDGSGQAIAIVDMYNDDPDAASDLNAFAQGIRTAAIRRCAGQSDL